MLKTILYRSRPRLATTISTTSIRNASSLVIGEHNNKTISNSTLATITAAKTIGGSVHVLLVGNNGSTKEPATAASAIEGVEKVYVCEGSSVENGIAENLTTLITSLTTAHKYTHLLTSSSNYGRNFVPRVAAKLDVAPISDITKVYNENSFERPLYAGNALAKITSSDKIKVVTVRSTAFEKAATTGGKATIETVPAPTDNGKTVFVKEEKVKSERPELTSASVVISGGRALGKAENFQLLYTLADKLGGAVGASRAAVDAGLAPNDLQVGQTGKVVAPNLYIAVGISGAIQHLAGMKDSKVIVAINKDPEAPIFQVADYGLVDDLFKAVPELTTKVK